MIGDDGGPAPAGSIERHFRDLLAELPEARAVVLRRRGGTPRLGAPARSCHAGLAAAVAPAGVHARDTRRGAPRRHRRYPFPPPRVPADGAGRFRNRENRGPRRSREAGREHDRLAFRPARSWLPFAMERHVARRANLVVGPTGAAKRVLVEEFGLSPWRVEVLAPGSRTCIPSENGRDAARRHLSIPTDLIVACCVRPLVSQVGLRILLDAWSTLIAERELTPRRSACS